MKMSLATEPFYQMRKQGHRRENEQEFIERLRKEK